MAKIEVWYNTHGKDMDLGDMVNTIITKSPTEVNIDNGAYMIDISGLEIKNYKALFNDEEDRDHRNDEEFMKEYEDFVKLASGMLTWKLEIQVSKKPEKLASLFMCLASNGNGGHSFDFQVGGKEYGYDGDGSDHISKVILNGEEIYKIKGRMPQKFIKKYIKEADYVDRSEDVTQWD